MAVAHCPTISFKARLSALRVTADLIWRTAFSQVCPGVLDDLDQHTFRDILMEGNDRAGYLRPHSILSLSLNSIPCACLV